MAHMAATLAAFAALLAVASGQIFSRCRNFQSTTDFTQAFVDKMTASNTGGYIVRFSNGANDACQRLQFVDGNDHNITFIDAANFVQNYTNRYTYKIADPTHPARLELTMHPRLLGADMRGRLNLIPLVARADLLAFVSCNEPLSTLSLYATEQVLVFTPFKTKNALSDTEIKAILEQANVPRINELKNISTNCVPGAATASNPVSLDIYNLISNIVNPFGGVSNMALTYGSPNQHPIEAREQVMRLFQEAGISPAQFYAQTGSQIIQNPSLTGAQASYNAFQKVAGTGRNPSYYNNAPLYYSDPAIQTAAMMANSFPFQNYNPANPLQHVYQSNRHPNFRSAANSHQGVNSVYSHQTANTGQQTHHHQASSIQQPSATVYNALNPQGSALPSASPFIQVQGAKVGAKETFYAY